MLKLIFLFLTTILIAGNCDTSLGGYSDRPKLIEDAIVQSLTRYASEHIATTQNLVLDHIKIIRVQTQVVAGISYKIDFNAQSAKGKLMSCQAVIYVQPDLTAKINEGQCHPA